MADLGLGTPRTSFADRIVTGRRSQLLGYLSRGWLRVSILALVAILVRTPALQGDRIWDDNFLARDNPFIKSPLLIFETFRHYLFLDSYSAHYRPVQNISYIIDYLFWNANTYGFHVTNVLLHAGSGVLLYFLLRHILPSLFFARVPLPVRERLTRRFPLFSTAAFCIALIWVVHPVHSAAVDYISGRADSLAFVFSAGGWLLFLRAQQVGRPSARVGIYALAAASGLLALLSREIAAVWMTLFVIHLFFVERRLRSRTAIGVLITTVLIAAAYVALRHLPDQRPPSAVDLRQPPPVRAVFMARALGDYGRLLINPVHLHMERTIESDHAAFRDNAHWRNMIAMEYLSILGLAVAAVFIFSCVKKGPGQSVRIFGVTWFLAGYLPISNLVQLNATAAEHWLYLPSVGFVVWLFGCVAEMPRRYRQLVFAGVILAASGLSLRSLSRSSDWLNEETFYRRTFEAGSRSARVALNLGQVYSNRGDYARAEKMFRSVLEQNPDYPSARINLATALYHVGKIAESEKLFAELERTSAQTRKSYARAWMGALNRAKLRHRDHDDTTALAILQQTKQQYPNVWELVALEAEILRQAGQIDTALQALQSFAGQNWWHHGAAIALGQLYAQKGDAEHAEEALRHASRLDVHDSKALNLLAALRVRQNRFDEAVTTQRRAIARQPDEPRQYVLLSNILEKMGRDDEARAALAQVSKMRDLARNEHESLN